MAVVAFSSDLVSVYRNTSNNLPPVTVADSYSTIEDGFLAPAGSVLDNDSDPEGSSLVAQLASGTSHGALTLRVSGNFSYTPDPNFAGTDTFEYRAIDDTGRPSAPTSVTISVEGADDPPTAQDDAYATDEDSALVQPAPGVLANDGDVDGPLPLVAAVEKAPSKGNVTLAPDGAFTYAPAANVSGPDSFTYRTSVGGLSAVATVRITINPVNDGPPVANDDNYATPVDTTFSIGFPGVLLNDSDPDDSALFVSGHDIASNGDVSIHPLGALSYTPNPGFVGVDAVRYGVTDGELTSFATVSITVGDPGPVEPVAAPDSYTTTQFTTLDVGAPGLLANDAGPSGEALFAGLVDPAVNGVVSVNADGSFSCYGPIAGDDSFVYRVYYGDPDDGTAVYSAPATVAIGVDPVSTDSVSIADADPVEEGDTGTKSMRFALTRTGALDQAATVRSHTEDGTATAGQDYTARVSRSVRFAAGISSVTVSVPIIGDRLDEGDETLRVVLDSSTGAPIGDGEAVGTIIDNDPPTLSVADESILERNPTSTATTVSMTFQVRLSRAWNVPVTVSWATEDITATAGADYVAASGIVTIPAGARRAIATVTVNRDRLAEVDETPRVVLSNPSGATIGDGEAIGTIRNDD